MSDQKKNKHSKGAMNVDEAANGWLSRTVDNRVNDVDLHTGFEIWITFRDSVLKIGGGVNIPLNTLGIIISKISLKKLSIIIMIILTLLVYFFPALRPLIEQIFSTLK